MLTIADGGGRGGQPNADHVDILINGELQQNPLMIKCNKNRPFRKWAQASWHQ